LRSCFPLSSRASNLPSLSHGFSFFGLASPLSSSLDHGPDSFYLTKLTRGTNISLHRSTPTFRRFSKNCFLSSPLAKSTQWVPPHRTRSSFRELIYATVIHRACGIENSKTRGGTGTPCCTVDSRIPYRFNSFDKDMLSLYPELTSLRPRGNRRDYINSITRMMNGDIVALGVNIEQVRHGMVADSFKFSIGWWIPQTSA
jgi:hypothetical protein